MKKHNWKIFGSSSKLSMYQCKDCGIIWSVVNAIDEKEKDESTNCDEIIAQNAVNRLLGEHVH